jgi:periplasmic protein TonB
MAYVRPNLFMEQERWKEPLVYSFVFHLVLTGSILLTAYVFGPHAVNNWGINNGEAVDATLVSASALPIPHVEESNNIVANESKGVTETKPQPKPVETDDGVSIPGKVKPQPVKPKPAQTASVRPPRPIPTPDTAVPYGEGGPVSGPYGAFSAPRTQGGFSFQNADFGTRFAYYVRAVNNTVSSNWFKPDVDAPHRAYIVFDIMRDGSVPYSSVHVTQSSGVPSLDQLAQRAVQRSTFGPLPPEYTGSKVSVEFWFDYKK